MELFEIDGEIIKKQILKVAEKPSDAKDIIRYLAYLNWDRVYKDRDEYIEFLVKRAESSAALASVTVERN